MPAVGVNRISVNRRQQPTGRYAVAGYNPEVVADFGSEYYRGLSAANFNGLLTYGGGGPRTMTDRDGKLKWAPHNLALQSDVFTDGNWLVQGALGGTKTTGIADRVGTNLAVRVTPASGTGDTYFQRNVAVAVVQGVYHTAEFEIYAGNYRYFSIFELQSGSGAGLIMLDTQTLTCIAAANGAVVGDGSISALGGGWFKIGYRFLPTSTAISPRVYPDADGSTAALSVTGNASDNFLVGRHRIYRSDLGGMVNNPDTGDSYVPTTSAARYLARRGHYKWNGSAWVNKGLRFESEARTNLCLYSQDLTQANHTKNGLTVGAPAVNGPDGNVSLNLVTVNATNSVHDTYQNITVSATTNGLYSMSRYFVMGTQRYVGIRAWRSAACWSTAVFDLQTGTVTQQSNGATSGTIYLAVIENMGGGLYRATLVSSQAGTTLYSQFAALSTGTPSLDANTGAESWPGASQTFYCGFCQDEAGSTPSSYIPTTSAAVTRAAETLSIAAAKLAWNAAGVSLSVKGEMDYADTNNGIEALPLGWELDGNNRLWQYFVTTGAATGQPATQHAVAGVRSYSVGSTTAYSPGLNTPFTWCSREGPTFSRIATNGVLASSASPAAMPDLSAANLQIAPTFMGTISLVREFGRDIGDAGITAAAA